MLIKQKSLEMMISVFIESLLVFICLVPFAGGENPWLFTKPFMMMLVPMLVLFILFHFIFKWDNIIPYFFTAFAVFILGIVMGLSIILAFFTAMFLLWRLTEALNGSTLDHLWVIYLFSVGIIFLYIIILGFFSPNFPHRAWFMIFFFIQTMFTVVCHLLQATQNGVLGKKVSISYTLTFGGVLLVAGLFAWFGPYISRLTRFIIEWFGIIVFYVFRVFWVLILAIRSDQFDQIWKQITKGGPKDNKKTHEWAQLSHYQPPDHYTITGIVFVIIVGFIIFYFLRRKWGRVSNQQVEKNLKRELYKGGMNRFIKTGGRKHKMKAPKDPIRLELFRLQKKLSEQNEGRLRYETLGEWLSRLPIKEEDMSTILNVYEKVRYGNKTIPEDESDRFKQVMVTIKQELEDIEKNKPNHWEKQQHDDPRKWWTKPPLY